MPWLTDVTGGYRGGHLGEYLEDFLDGRLDERRQRLAARHLVCCTSCREEHRAAVALRERVRSAPVDETRQADVMAGLLALSGTLRAQTPEVSAARCGHRGVSESAGSYSTGLYSAGSALEAGGLSGPGIAAASVGPRPGVVALDAPPQYSRRRRGPVAGALACCALVVGVMTVVGAHPQRNAPSDPRHLRVAQQAPATADAVVFVTVDSARSLNRGSDVGENLRNR